MVASQEARGCAPGENLPNGAASPRVDPGASQAAQRPTLLSLASERRELEALLAETGGDLSDPAVSALWDANADALMAKVDGYAGYVMDLEAMADRADEAAKACKAKAQALRNARQRLLDRALLALGPDGKSLEGEAFRLVRRQNPEAVLVTDEAALKESLPEAFREVVEVKLERATVKAALQRNPEAVRGAVLTRSERVDVRA